MKFLTLFSTLSNNDQKKFRQMAKQHFAHNEKLLLLIEELSQNPLSETAKISLQTQLLADGKERKQKANVYFNRNLTELTSFLEDYIICLSLNENKWQKDLLLIKYLRKHKTQVSELLIEETLRDFRKNLLDSPAKDWQFYYAEFQYFGFLLEFRNLYYFKKGRNELLQDTLVARNYSFQNAIIGEYFYEIILNKDRLNMPLMNKILAYSETVERDNELLFALKSIYDLVMTKDFSIQKCLELFALDKNQNSLFVHLSSDAKQNIYRLLLERCIQAATSNHRYYPYLYDYYVAGFKNNCLLINGDFSEKEFRRILLAYMYKYENTIGIMSQQQNAQILAHIQQDFPTMKTYKDYNDSLINVRANWRFQKGDFIGVTNELQGLVYTDLFFYDNLFLNLYAQFEIALHRKQPSFAPDFTDVNLCLRRIKDLKEPTQKVKITLTAFKMLMQLIKNPNEENDNMLSDYLKKHDVYMKKWMERKLSMLWSE